VDKLQGNEREVLETKIKKAGDITGGNFKREGSYPDKEIDITKGTSKYEGWGTALKPAHEPIVMARKPFKGTVAENVLEHGTGGINIDGCRVETNEEITNHSRGKESAISKGKYGDSKAQETHQTEGQKLGRFPANVMHDGSEEVLEIFPQTNKSSGGRSYQNTNQMYSGGWADEKGKKIDPGFGDEGTAARYFYCAKASKKDRDEGLDEFTDKNLYVGKDRRKPLLNISENRNKSVKNTHPTVKPTELMRYLCRLVTPKGGVVLDPFMGSGSTGKGALLEGFKFVGIEMEREYFDIACARLEALQNNMQGDMFD
jgi:site-specific DNA-methyltransferase (adenine-specific)